MRKWTGCIALVVFTLALAQAANASFCPLFGKSKKSGPPPMYRGLPPVVALMPAQALTQPGTAPQSMVLVPVYLRPQPPMRGMPRYYGYRR